MKENTMTRERLGIFFSLVFLSVLIYAVVFIDLLNFPTNSIFPPMIFSILLIGFFNKIK